MHWLQVNSQRFTLALLDLGLPDGSGVDVVIGALREKQPEVQSVIVTIHDDDEHHLPRPASRRLWLPAEGTVARVARWNSCNASASGEPPLSPSIARKVIAYFASQRQVPTPPTLLHEVSLTERETEVLLRVAKGYTLPEIGVQLGLSRHTIADYVKQIYRKLNVSFAC